VLQDAEGFLWFGTNDGACRYDGADFETLRSEGADASEWINRIVADSTGALWFAAGGNGVFVRRDGAFETIAQTDGAADGVITLMVDREGAIWAGSRGLLRLGPAGFERVAIRAGSIDDSVFTLFEDHFGRLWVATDRTLYVLARRGSELEVIARRDDVWVSAIASADSSSLWIGSTAGLERVSVSEGVPDLSPSAAARPIPALDGEWVRALLVDARGSLWAGTQGRGVFRLDRAGDVARYTTDAGLASNDVLDILEDREGSLWFATTEGVGRLADEQIMTWTTRDGLPHNTVMFVTEDRGGGIWMGTIQGVVRVDVAAGGSAMAGLGSSPGSTSPDDFGLGRTFMLHALRDRAGEVWIGHDRGLSRAVRRGGAWTLHTYGAESGWVDAPSARNRARTIFEDREGLHWIGCDWGVSLLSNDHFVNFSFPALTESLVVAMQQDDVGDLWLGFTSDGIVRCAVATDSAGVTTLTERERFNVASGHLRDDRVRAAGKDGEGRLWFGCRTGGAARFTVVDGAVTDVTHFDVHSGLANDYVRSFLLARDGDFWIGTDEGAQVLSTDVEGRTSFHRIDADPGLAGAGVQHVYEARGRMWFATTVGVSSYRESPSPLAPSPPPVKITTFRVFGVPDADALAASHAELASSQHSVAFSFVGLTYRDEKATRYRYMLTGADTGWRLTTNRSVDFAHLPPGRYVFRVAASRADGIWSEQPAEFSFHIAAPFWRRPWFVALVGTTMVALAFAAHRYRLQRALELERVRASIASDLHDDVGSTLSSISILSDLARRSSPASPAADLLSRIETNARTMLDAMDDIVWSIRPENDSYDAVAQRMHAFGAEIGGDSGISFRMERTGSAPRFPMAARHDLYLVFKELVTNAVRHARCHEIVVRLSASERVIELTVRDDGVGLPPGAADGSLRDGDGLGNVRRRVERLGGTVSFETVSSGTVSSGTVSSGTVSSSSADKGTESIGDGPGSAAKIGGTPMIRVAIFEDNGPLRDALTRLVDEERDLTCVGAFASCDRAEDDVAAAKPNVVLMDIGLPGISGIEGVRRIRARFPEVEVLMLTVQAHEQAIFESICAGACGYLLKKATPGALLRAIREAAGGGAPLSPEIARRVFAMLQGRRLAPAPDCRLSPRERDVLAGLVEGHPYKRIAVDLGISIDTVRTHIKAIYEKLHVHSRSEAVARAIREGWF
jgi:DNA-binding NarL/FixJ family response regulator/ligand-binding sensor domain-containing protein/signal transduction histidine kinase